MRELGLRWLRYGPPYYRIHTGPDQYDWEFTDLVFAEMQRLGIVPIVDLCHFGSARLGRGLPEPGLAPALCPLRPCLRRALPRVRFYTPVNEIYVCAKLDAPGSGTSARQGHRAFVTALKHTSAGPICLLSKRS